MTVTTKGNSQLVLTVLLDRVWPPRDKIMDRHMNVLNETSLREITFEL
jgi:hypothetical protein